MHLFYKSKVVSLRQGYTRASSGEPPHTFVEQRHPTVAEICSMKGREGKTPKLSTWHQATLPPGPWKMW